MIRALVTGTLHDAPQSRTSKNGNAYATAKVRAEGKDGAAAWVSVIAFGELAELLAELHDGAALSVSGRAEVSAWLDKQGEPKAGLSVVADDMTTLKKAKRKPRGAGGRKPRKAGTVREPESVGVPFDDLAELLAV